MIVARGATQAQTDLSPISRKILHIGERDFIRERALRKIIAVKRERRMTRGVTI